jgi:hypothetical protein
MADEDGFEHALDPGVIDKAAAALSKVDSPEPDEPQDNIVLLLAGFRTKNGDVHSVEVRELTGEDEEVLARTARTGNNNVFHFMNAVIDCGVVRIGQEKKTENDRILKQLLIGDRDAILLGIRRATYGDTIQLDDWICPSCGESSDIEIPMEDIPVREFKEKVFTVPLRKGGEAEVKLANGGDQLAVWNDVKLNAKERDSLLLSRCLVSITDKDGNKRQAAGQAGGMARRLSVPDRAAILKQLNDAQPGPRLVDLKITHNTCGDEVSLGVGLAELFPDLLVV